MHYLTKIMEGNEDPSYLDELRSYTLKWIKNIDKMLAYTDKIINWWNERHMQKLVEENYVKRSRK